MSQWKRIEQQLNSFILFGGMMTAEARRKTAELLFLYLYDPDFKAKEQLRQSSIPYHHPNWARILEQIFGRQDLREISRNNEDLAFSLARETLEWAKRTFLKFEASHQQVEEEQKLKEFEEGGSRLNLEKWTEQLDRLTRLHPSHRRNWRFYGQTLTELQKNGGSSRSRQEAEILRSNILHDWRRFIEQGKEQEEASFLNKSFDRYFDTLGRKIEKLYDLGDLLSPFYGFLGLAWNDSLGNWNKINVSQLESYAESLSRDRTLRELAELLGRFKRAQQQTKEMRRQRLLPRKQWKPNPYGRSEIIGIHHSNEISRMLPSEVALLSSPETEVILSKKYVEKKLLTFQYRSEDMSTTYEEEEEIVPDQEPDDLGPIILCVDTSGSMFGAPERVAKALALAILEMALQQKRRVFLISFSTGLKAIEMTGVERDLSEFIEFLRMSFHGGTDIQPALEEALATMEREEYHDADLLVISDFVIPRLTRKTFERVEKARKKRATKFHSLFITRRPDPRTLPPPIFDQHWVYDLDNPAVVRQAVDRLQLMVGEEEKGEDG